MNLISKIMPILILLLVVVVVWVGVSVTHQAVDLDVDPKAENLTKPVQGNFDIDIIEKVTEKTEESFPVSPQEFLRLNTPD